MKPTNILTATATILMLSSLLSGCKIESPEATPASNASQETATEPVISTETQQVLQKAETVKKEAYLKLEKEVVGNELVVRIIIDNPAQKPINSAQTWLSYNPAQLIGEKINASDSVFLLTAPFDNTFDEEAGLVMIGRSNPTPLTDTSLLVAEVTFTINSSDPTVIDAYDYREDLTGRTSANILIDEMAYNILLKPETPLLIVNNN